MKTAPPAIFPIFRSQLTIAILERLYVGGGECSVKRHEAEYPGQATYIDEDAVLEDLPKAEAIVDAAAKALPHLSPFIVEQAE